ncbi:metal-dependent hydrolase [Poseidonibacter lekithochrous]|uniref:aminofutalosine deaminase family hydrolase n=1 Tax=Poseidonibacter TaxID=2321187 RepID=UPI001C09F03A|nr:MULTISPECIES: metal-dependent hydrolase [Poseidonibacter]MBU3015336.1 metal-dependent hydrolase [Poseidonibacter lekithochrous]MDO6828633.1 metal-dependent hydrolase [Poseidonibacter sp. 1_MG-2023]
MNILSANWVITCDENFSIIKNGAIVFEDKIVDIDTIDNIRNKYPNEEVLEAESNSVLMPGLINSHVHLEFSANSTTLKYGNFLSWLNSVIKNRDTLIEKATNKLISIKLDRMKKTGTTTIGAISSYSFDLEACVKSPLNTVFFCEVIGSKADMADTLFADFKSRLSSAKLNTSKNFIPAVAIHSPYSVHPFLVRESLALAKAEDLSVSTHFLESPEEFEWLHKDEGLFIEFFKNFLNQTKAVTKPMEFLTHFSNVKKLSFTHCVEASANDFEKIKSLGAVINHCPTSNRVLNNSKLDLSKLEGIDFSIGTDGLSSNNSLSMFDELRTALMIHSNENIVELSKKLLKAATINGSKALGLNKGVLEKHKDADIISFKLADEVEDKEDLAMQIILHTKSVNKTIIGGVIV